MSELADELQAENKRLNLEVTVTNDAWIAMQRERDELRDKVERLRAALRQAIQVADRWPIEEKPYVEGVVAKLISEPLRACQT